MRQRVQGLVFILATLANEPLTFHVAIDNGFFGGKGMCTVSPHSLGKLLASAKRPSHRREATPVSATQPPWKHYT
eukprot:5758618-Pyramimonas_sp.AAC.1